MVAVLDRGNWLGHWSSRSDSSCALNRYTGIDQRVLARSGLGQRCNFRLIAGEHDLLAFYFVGAVCHLAAEGFPVAYSVYSAGVILQS